MKIVGTIELHISPENESLIPMLVNFNGSQREGEEVQDSACRVLGEETKKLIAEQLIIQHLNTYFGIAGSERVQGIRDLLNNGALTTAFEVVE